MPFNRVYYIEQTTNWGDSRIVKLVVVVKGEGARISMDTFKRAWGAEKVLPFSIQVHPLVASALLRKNFARTI